MRQILRLAGAPEVGEIGRAQSELQSLRHLVCRLLLEKKKGEIAKAERAGWRVAERLQHRIVEGARGGRATDRAGRRETMNPIALVTDVLLDGCEGDGG